MNLNLYNEILEFIHKHPGHIKDLPYILERKYPDIAKLTLISIVSNECQRITRKANHKSSDVVDRIFNAYIEGRLKQECPQTYITDLNKLDRRKIINIAVENKIPATLVSRIILMKFLLKANEKEDDVEAIKPTKRNLSDLLANTHLINDADLSVEVYWGVLYDNYYSPLGDFVKQQLGYEYEVKLKYCCTRENMAFKDEVTLRKEGYDKTPDVKLELPVLVNGIPIMWIESKALFADNDIHQTYIKDQYLGYWNRWGPGLVLYWFGFSEDIINPTEKRFIVMSEFPNSDVITHLKSAQVDLQNLEYTEVKPAYECNVEAEPRTLANNADHQIVPS